MGFIIENNHLPSGCGLFSMINPWLPCYNYYFWYLHHFRIRMRTHTFTFALPSITRDNYDFERKAAARRDDASEELLPTFWIRPATWLHFIHEIAVPISSSPQCSWWGLVLAETRPAQWVTLHNIYLGLYFLGRCGSLIVHVHDNSLWTLNWCDKYYWVSFSVSMDLKRSSYQCTVRWTMQGLMESFFNCCNSRPKLVWCVQFYWTRDNFSITKWHLQQSAPSDS